MTEEEKPECRLTYREGNEISRKMSARYFLRALMWIFLGAFMALVIQIAADAKYGVLWQGVEVLKERALQGDMQALFDYLGHGSMTEMGGLIILAMGVLALMEIYAGEKKIKEALKEANEEKTKRWTRE